jgi:hypothetical protein
MGARGRDRRSRPVSAAATRQPRRASTEGSSDPSAEDHGEFARRHGIHGRGRLG